MEKEKIAIEEFIADAEKYCKYFKELKEERGIDIAVISLCEGNLKAGKKFPYIIVEGQEETDRHKYDGEYPPILYVVKRKSDEKYFGIDTYCMKIQDKWLTELHTVLVYEKKWQ